MKPVFEKLEQMKIQVSDLFVDKMKIADMKLLAEMWNFKKTSLQATWLLKVKIDSDCK